MAPQPARRAGSAPLPVARRADVRPSTAPPAAVRHSLSVPLPRSEILPVRRITPARRRIHSPAVSRVDPLEDERYTEEMFFFLTGVRKYQFRYFYNEYCGVGTPIDSNHKLFALLRWYKQYPRARELGDTLGVRRQGTRILYDVQRWSEWLARRINNAEVLKGWRTRFAPRNRVPVPDALFGGQVTGHLDTFPIYLCKPKSAAMQRYTYSGKYGANVLKVQMVVDNTGTPIWYSGPHLGTYADIRLARMHMPAGMRETERFLADKAYCARNTPWLTKPFKKAPMRRRRAGQPSPPPPPRLTRQQHAFNKVCGVQAHARNTPSTHTVLTASFMPHACVRCCAGASVVSGHGRARVRLHQALSHTGRAVQR